MKMAQIKNQSKQKIQRNPKRENPNLTMIVTMKMRKQKTLRRVLLHQNAVEKTRKMNPNQDQIQKSKSKETVLPLK